LRYLSLILLPALASGLLLLLAGFLLATAALLTALTRLLFLLTWLLTTATLLSALAWILVVMTLVSPAGKFPQRTTFIPQVRSSGKVIQLMHLTAGHRAGGLNKANKAQIAKDCSEQFHTDAKLDRQLLGLPTPGSDPVGRERR